jgi:hypothetical protein
MGRFWDDPRTIAKADGATGKENDSRLPMYLYEVRPRKEKRGVDLISDVLPFFCGMANRTRLATQIGYTNAS